MATVSCKQTCWIVLIVVTLVLTPAVALRADENTEDSTSSKSQQQESVFQTLKRKTRALFGSDSQTEKTQKETSETVEENPEEETSPQKSPGRKAIDSFKKGMNKISDNISESVERDKKTLKKKFDKLSD